ncbi:MAG: iron-sulfur cluster assembly scaffold protein [Desulfohalobiaceae bacterium]
MSDTPELDRMLQDVQQETDQAALEKYGPLVVERWRTMPYFGALAASNASARITGTCGDTMEIFLNISDERVADAGFLTTGCASSLVSCSACCELAMGASLEDAASISPEDVLELLGGLPGEDLHCAGLAVQTLQAAIGNFLSGKP